MQRVNARRRYAIRPGFVAGAKDSPQLEPRRHCCRSLANGNYNIETQRSFQSKREIALKVAKRDSLLPCLALI